MTFYGSVDCHPEASCISVQHLDDRRGANGETQVHGRGTNRFRFNKQYVLPLEIMVMGCDGRCFSSGVDGPGKGRGILSSH